VCPRPSFLTAGHSLSHVSGSNYIVAFWTHLIHNSAYHPQTYGRRERVNQILEDML
jgi:hypothetical protein